MGALLHIASLCLPSFPPAFLPPTSLAATLRSAATPARSSEHQLQQQRIISLVINGDALGNCYRAAHSLSRPPPSPRSGPLIVVRSRARVLSLLRPRSKSLPLLPYPSRSPSLSLSFSLVLASANHPLRSSSTRFILAASQASSCHETAFRT